MSTRIEQLAGVADAMHAILVKRVDQLASSIDGAADITEYMALVVTIVAYERQRWPLGKVPGGKG